MAAEAAASGAAGAAGVAGVAVGEAAAGVDAVVADAGAHAAKAAAVEDGGAVGAAMDAGGTPPRGIINDPPDRYGDVPFAVCRGMDSGCCARGGGAENGSGCTDCMDCTGDISGA